MGNKFTISYGSAAPATSKLLPYELGLDNVTNTLYIGKAGGTSVALNTADTVGAIKRAGDTVVNGHFVYYNTSPVATISLFYSGSPFELREAGDVRDTQSDDVYSPSIGFRWKNVAGAAIVMPSDGKFYRITNSGNKYRIYDAQDAIPVTGGGTGATDAAGARSAIGAAAASHDHSTSDITSGTLSVGRGGTGQTTLAAFRNSIGLGNSTSTLAIANGGTGATTAAGIRDAIGLGNTTGALPVANGGFAASNARDGVNNIFAMGLKERTQIPADSDFNTYIVPGNYAVASSATTNSIANTPCKRAGTLTVMASLGNTNSVHITQIYMAFDISEASLGAGVWIRQYVNSVWRQWTKVVTELGDTSTTTPGATLSVAHSYFKLTKIGRMVDFHMRFSATVASGVTSFANAIPTDYRPDAGSVTPLSAYISANTICNAYVDGGQITVRLSAAADAVVLKGSWLAAY